MLIESLRPFLRGLSEGMDSAADVVLQPEEAYEWRARRKGWLMSAIALCNSPYATIIHNFWGQELRYTFASVYSAGLTSPNGETNWVSAYDTANSLYAMVYAPRPYKYFREGSRIAIYNPTPSQIRLQGVGFHYIEVVDGGELLRSLREVLGRSPVG